MPSTNGHKKTALLYTRVSDDKQRDHGHSLSDQRRELEAWAAKEGYDILQVIEDAAWSGGDLARPGMDELRNRVAWGGVDAVVVLFRDRLARGVYAGLLAEEFAQHGCQLIALNAQVDDSPEGELHGGMLDVIAAWERKKIAERTKRGRLEKVRRGKVIAGRMAKYGRAKYGFKLNAAHDGLVVDEEAMSVVWRMFYMVAVEKKSLRAVKKTLEAESVPTPTGRTKYWSMSVIRDCLLNDVYRPHTFEEIAQLVTPEVAAQLDPNKHYGVWWFGKRRSTRIQVSEPGVNGRVYRKKLKATIKPREEWIGVPVPDSGIPRELVDAARADVQDNTRPSNAGRRFWELSGGIARCGGCGHALVPVTATCSKYGRKYFYYACRAKHKHVREACAGGKHHPAVKLESQVWEFVRSLLCNPDQLRADLEQVIELERNTTVRGNPKREAKVWLDKLAEVDHKRSAYQDQQAEGLITMDELRTKLAALDTTREVARKELEALRGREERIEELERDKDALLESYAALAPEAIESLTPEERRRVHEMFQLRVVVDPDGRVEVSGAFVEGTEFSELSASSTR